MLLISAPCQAKSGPRRLNYTMSMYIGTKALKASDRYQSLGADTNSLGKEVDYQGSRQIDNFSRRYYEKELGAGIGPSPGFSEMFGYTEPFRRFVQHETFTPQANEIRNTAASWLPGDDYYTNFHNGDPFIKIDDGYARLPGAGYAALHPELKDVDPEDYPDIHKMSILADVAPYSREYHTFRQKVGQQAQGNTELEIEYEKILNRVKQTRESVIKMNDRHFTEPVDEISGTVDEVSAGGITLNEFPGRRFQFSSVSTSAADMSARILGEKNDMTRALRPSPQNGRGRAPGRRVLRPSSPKNSRAHAPEAGPCRPETCFSQAMKIVHFGPFWRSGFLAEFAVKR